MSGTSDEPGPVPPEPTPEAVISGAKKAFPPSGHPLAVLVHDSLVDTGAPGPDHRLTFEHAELTLEVDVEVRPAGIRLTGRLTADRDRVLLRAADEDLALVCEVEDRRFGFGPVPHGLIRLAVEGSGTDVWTDWFRV